MNASRARIECRIAAATRDALPCVASPTDPAEPPVPPSAEDDRTRGFGLVEAGDFDEAVEPLRRASLRLPRDVALVGALAEALFRSGRVREAVARMRQRIRLAPDTPGFHYDLGQALARLGDERDAVRELERAVSLAPQFAVARADLARLLLRAGRLDAAEAHFRAVIATDPLWSVPRAGLGTVLLARHRTDDAIALFREALERDPGDVESANALGVALMDAGRLHDAIDALRAAQAMHPSHVTTRINLGAALRQAGSLDDAIAVHRAATEEAPDSAAAWDALAQDLAAVDDVDGAVTAGREAVACAPAVATFHAHLGNLLAEAGDWTAAIAAYRDALRRDPDLAIARWNLSLAELATGDFRRGWIDYEARWACAAFPSPRRGFAAPPLTALAQAKGRTVLVHAEQGLGDTLQFIRFVPRLVAGGATVIVEVPRALHRLLARMDRIGTLVVAGDPLPPFDRHVPLLSLPLLLGADRPDGSTVPYLGAAATRDAADRSRPRVGVVWAGGPQHVADRRRSMRLEAIRPWLARSDVAWIGLQKEIPAVDRPLFDALHAEHPSIACGVDLEDFAATADLIATLDLVVTVDTAVAHLAGAMGKPVWILLPRVPDFRWLLDGDATDWYPTAVLFRSDASGWGPVVDAVSARLDDAVATRAG